MQNSFQCRILVTDLKKAWLLQTGHWCSLQVSRDVGGIGGRRRGEGTKKGLCGDWHGGKWSLTSANEQPHMSVLLFPKTEKGKGEVWTFPELQAANNELLCLDGDVWCCNNRIHWSEIFVLWWSINILAIHLTSHIIKLQGFIFIVMQEKTIIQTLQRLNLSKYNLSSLLLNPQTGPLKLGANSRQPSLKLTVSLVDDASLFLKLSTGSSLQHQPPFYTILLLLHSVFSDLLIKWLKIYSWSVQLVGILL